MVDKNVRRKILVKLEKLWDKYPDQRLGQLLENYVFFKGQRGDTTSVRLFFQPDEETFEILKTEIKKKVKMVKKYFDTELPNGTRLKEGKMPIIPFKEPCPKCGSHYLKLKEPRKSWLTKCLDCGYEFDYPDHS